MEWLTWITAGEIALGLAFLAVCWLMIKPPKG